MVLSSGAKYEGTRDETGRPDGRGVLTFRRYQQFASLENSTHARNMHTFASGNKYEGEFKEGKFHGRGVLQQCMGTEDTVFDWNLLPSFYGVRYEGEFRNGIRHGSGVLTFANGNTYSGTWNARGKFDWSLLSQMPQSED